MPEWKKILCMIITIFYLFFSLPKVFGADMIYGVGIHPESFKGTPEELLKLMKKYGVQSYRTDLIWQHVESRKGVYNFPTKNYEKLINLSLKDKIPVIIILTYGNKNYEDFNKKNPRGKPTKETSIIAFSNYAQWAAESINRDNVIFEVWNEWIQMAGKNNRGNALSSESATIYARLVNESCKKIKKVNPRIKVIAGGISPLDPDSVKWFKKFIDFGGMDCADGISLHPYNFSKYKKLDILKPFNSIVTFYNDLAVKYNKKFPIYITETGVPDGVSYRKSEEEVSNHLKNYYQIAKRYSFIQGVWWYDFINDGLDATNKEHNFGLLENNLKPKASAKAFKSLHSNE